MKEDMKYALSMILFYILVMSGVIGVTSFGMYAHNEWKDYQTYKEGLKRDELRKEIRDEIRRSQSGPQHDTEH